LSLVESRKKGKNNTGSPDYLAFSNEAYQMLLSRYVKEAKDLTAVDRAATPEEENQIKNAFENDWKIGKQSDRSANSTIKPLEKFSSFEEDWRDIYEKREGARKTEWDQHLQKIRDVQRAMELQEQNARWNELTAFRCNPWNELSLFKLMLGRPPIWRKGITEKREFDIGRVTRTYYSILIRKKLSMHILSFAFAKKSGCHSVSALMLLRQILPRQVCNVLCDIPLSGRLQRL